MIEQLDYLRQLNMESMVLRILLAVIMGGAIGFDRELKRRPAGFRTYMLVAMGAALTMILGQYLDLMLDTFMAEDYAVVNRRTDVVRLGAGVVSGIGFMGTGTILITARQEVKGLTTASGLWASACMGLAVGAGFYECTLVGFLLIMVSMKIMPLVERAMLARALNMDVYVELEGIENISPLIECIKEEGISLYDVDVTKEQRGSLMYMSGLISMRLPSRRRHTEVLAMLSTIEGVLAVDEI